MNNIWTRVKIELKNFFFDNKGKFYSMVVAIGAILVIFTFVLNFIQINKKAKIELVNISIDEDSDSSSIDIKVRNTGNLVAYLYCVKVYILDSFQMKEIYYNACNEIKSDIELSDKSDPVNSGTNIDGSTDIEDIIEWDVPLIPMDSSKNYLIELNDEKVQEFNISQVVRENDVDRFTLTFTDDEKQKEVPSVKCIYIEIYFDKNDYVTTSKMVIPLNVDGIIYDKNISEINLENVRENYEILLKINNYMDAIRTEKYELLLSGYEDNKNDFFEYRY